VITHANGFPSRTVPGSPTLRVVPRSGAVNLDWDPPASDGGAPILGYRLTRLDPSLGPVVIDVGPETTSYTDTGLVDGAPYEYTVVGWSILGDGQAASAGPVTPLQLPNTPDIFRVTGYDRSARIEWDAWDRPENATAGFRIYRTGPDEQRTLIGTVGADVRSYTDAPVENDVGYGYEVTAFNAGGESEPSRVLTVYPQGLQAAEATRAGWVPPDTRFRSQTAPIDPPAATQRPPIVHAGPRGQG